VRARWVVLGLVAAGAVAAFFLRGSGLTARREPWPLEGRVAKTAWRFLVPADVRDRPNPLPNDAAVLTAGLEHFADHCAICHANDGSGDTPVGRNVFPRSPDMRLSATQRLTDGELFYAIEFGIPWTAMPAWGNGTPDGERQSWELVRFIRHLPAITADQLARMAELNPRSPAAAARDREIDEFLKGKGKE
jgi:mono/diheme cytochrome c family protein